MAMAQETEEVVIMVGRLDEAVPGPQVVTVDDPQSDRGWSIKKCVWVLTGVDTIADDDVSLVPSSLSWQSSSLSSAASVQRWQCDD